jgi:CubicO group peptidase (beta-lactamase class C family)/ketosteroid isomerase-like protein
MPPDAAHWADRLQALATETEVVGAALGIWHDGVQITAAHGVLSTATQVVVTPDTLFQIGSITKVWTTSMIMQLADEGRLSLESSIAELLPGLPIGRPDRANDVRIRHLLTHTSGIDGDIFTDTGRGDDCVERYVGLLADAPTIFPVGAAYSYCNSGFVLLGRIVEVLDARTWEESLRERLVRPMSLTNTVTLAEQAILHRTAVGHRERPYAWKPVTTWALPRGVGPAGLICADVGDVLAFARLHLDNGLTADGRRLLTTESVKAMQTPQMPIPGIAGAGDAVGLGWHLTLWGGRRIVGHDGGTIGQLAYLRLDPEARLAVCLLTNSSVSSALYERLFGEIFEAYAGVRPPALGPPEHVDLEADLERHTGRYERTSARFDVSLLGGELHVLARPTGDADIFDEAPQDLTLHPVDPQGTTFLTRAHDEDPWSEIAFSAFPDGSPYLFSGGRVTPIVKVAAVDRADAQAWLDRYVAAWLSYDANDIAALFAEDIAYRYHPYDDPIVGRAAVVASWLGEDTSNGASTRDAPGTYAAHYEPVAVDGDVVVATGTSTYRERPDGPIVRIYDNCFVMRFDAEGRCREFTEYYLKRP